MAKSKKTVRKERLPTASSVAEAKPSPTFSYNGFNVVGLVFQLVPMVPLAEGEGPPSPRPVQLTVNAGAGVSDQVGPDGTVIGQLRLVVAVVPDPRIQPYLVTVDAIGTFSTKDGTAEQLGDFLRRASPGIMFPYIREIIDRTTAQAPQGVLRLDPMNINQLINQTPWTDPERAQAPTSVSTAP